jgi:hypothetical protein
MFVALPFPSCCAARQQQQYQAYQQLIFDIGGLEGHVCGRDIGRRDPAVAGRSFDRAKLKTNLVFGSPNKRACNLTRCAGGVPKKGESERVVG